VLGVSACLVTMVRGVGSYRTRGNEFRRRSFCTEPAYAMPATDNRERDVIGDVVVGLAPML
jgi:hypothetical protein